MAKSRAKSKIARAMHKFYEGDLHSGSKKGPVVKSRAQAEAIGESEERVKEEHGGKYPHHKRGGKKRL